MKKLLIYIAFGALVVSTLSSCFASRRDCRGVRHVKLKNGIYL